MAALDAQYGSASSNGDTGIEGARRDASISTRDAQYYASRDTLWAGTLSGSATLGNTPWTLKAITAASAQAAYSTNRARAQAAHDAALLSAIDNWQTSNRSSTLSLLVAEGQSREAYNKATATVYANWELGIGNLLWDKPAGTSWEGNQHIANQEQPPSIGLKTTPTAKAGLQLVSANDDPPSQDEEVPEDGNIWSLPNRPSPKQLEPLYDHYGKEVADQMIESRWPSKPILESKYSMGAYVPNDEERFAQSIPGYWRLQRLLELSESGVLSAREREEAQALASEYMFRYRLARGSDGSFLGYLNMATGLTIAGQNPSFNQFMSGAAALVATRPTAVRPAVRLDVKPRYTQQPVVPAPWNAPKPVTPSLPQNKIPPVASAPALGKILENVPNSLPTPSAGDLSKLGSAAGKGDLTKAGHSLSKHAVGKRAGSSAFPDPMGSPAQINQQAQKLLHDILNDPASMIKQRPGRPGEHLLQVFRPDGSGVIYKWDGSQWVFSHFAENLF